MTNKKELKDEELEKVNGGTPITGQCGEPVVYKCCKKYNNDIKQCVICAGNPTQKRH